MFFNNFKASEEQLLIENLIIEMIRIYGEDVQYVPRNITNADQLYTADDQSTYTDPYMIEMYIKSVDGFTGDGNFMSKFGLEIRDQVVFSVAQRVFLSEVGAYTAQVRPNEGDLIYFPLNQKTFQIKFVNKLEMFYQLGAVQTWELTCELFEYSNEIINTGIPEIDALQNKFSTNIFDWGITDENDNTLTDESGNYLVVESFNLDTIIPTESNDDLAAEANNIIVWGVHDPFSEGDNA